MVKVMGVLLAVLNVIPLLGVLASPLLIFVSFFFFDSPGATRNPLVFALALAVWSYPVTAGLGGFRALKAYGAGDLHGMSRWTCCTYSSVGAIVAIYALLAIQEMSRPG